MPEGMTVCRKLSGLEIRVSLITYKRLEIADERLGIIKSLETGELTLKTAD